jgi:peptidoglycan/LPS O-acetylase OafA/YrhL
MSNGPARTSPRTMLAAMRMRRVAVGALIVGLCLAAATAITALVSGDFDDTHARLIASSLGFGVFSALGAAGARLWRDALGWRRGLGGGTAAAAVLAYALLIAALWLFDDEDAIWRAFGMAGLLAGAASYGRASSESTMADFTSAPPPTSQPAWPKSVSSSSSSFSPSSR